MGPLGDGTATCGAASGAVHSAPTVCILEAGRDTLSPPETLEMLPEISLLYLDSSRKGWAHCCIYFGVIETSDLSVNVHEDRHSPGQRGKVQCSLRSAWDSRRAGGRPARCHVVFCTTGTPGGHAPPHTRPAAEPRGLGLPGPARHPTSCSVPSLPTAPSSPTPSGNYAGNPASHFWRCF